MRQRSIRSFSVLVILATSAFACARVTAQTATPKATATADAAFLARANGLLERSRKLIDTFFEQTSNVVCTEAVSQAIVGHNDKPMYREDSTFEYQMQAGMREGVLHLSETREPKKAAYRDPYKTLLITNGFASLLLILHENYESSYVFEPVSEENIDGRFTLKVEFKPVPNTPSPAAIEVRNQNYPLQLKGEIWIDEETAAVVKLVSTLDNNLEDLGLRELRSEIHYTIVQFHQPEEAYWMPLSAVIDVQTPKQHWRNVHHFTDFRRFRATIQVQMGASEP